MENCNKIKDGKGRLALEEAEVRRIRKEYFDDLCNIDTQERVPEFNGPGIHKPLYNFEIYLTFC